jgi:hypothetical protein
MSELQDQQQAYRSSQEDILLTKSDNKIERRQRLNFQVDEGHNSKQTEDNHYLGRIPQIKSINAHRHCKCRDNNLRTSSKKMLS